MSSLATTALRPFVPGGKDFAQSKRFYMELGFRLTFEAEDVAGFACDGGGFLLQNHYDAGWAGNFMMQLLVEDLHAWWTHIQALDLPGGYGVPAPKPPKLMPWGLTVAFVIGPCGELWHFVQA